MLPAVLALQLAPYDAVKHLLLGVGPAAPRLASHAHLARGEQLVTTHRELPPHLPAFLPTAAARARLVRFGVGVRVRVGFGLGLGEGRVGARARVRFTRPD